MPEYRRWRVPGASYFFTVVTAGRRPILTTAAGRAALRAAIADVRMDRPFEMWCIVLLPDHLHCIWHLPPGDDDYPT
ncbi:MAG: transposase, partial [Phycisphaerae bacterium]|nr:transposase [Phycisphaerae bacterium]